MGNNSVGAACPPGLKPCGLEAAAIGFRSNRYNKLNPLTMQALRADQINALMIRQGPLRTILGFLLDGTSLVVSAVPAFAAFEAGSAVKFDAGAFGAEPDHRAF